MSELIQKKIRQYLVHSFIYYQLDESIILDKQYDKICKEVFYLMKNQSQSNRLPYQEILKKAYLKKLPPFLLKNIQLKSLVLLCTYYISRVNLSL